jgi:hypothetical protein
VQPARRFWGWGVDGEGPSPDQQRKLGATIAARFGGDAADPIPPPTIDEVALREPRVVTRAPLH